MLRSIKERVKESIKTYLESQEKQAKVLGNEIEKELNLLDETNQKKSIVGQAVRFCPSHIHLSDPYVRENFGALSRGYDEENIYKEFISLIRDYTMVTYDGLISLCDIVRNCEQKGITGDFAEAGVWKGGATALMSLVSSKFGNKPRMIHAFDSFIGLPEPIGEKDFDVRYLNMEETFKISKEESKGNLRPINALCAEKETFRKLLVDKIGHPTDKLMIYEGWFQDTIPKAIDKIEELAILRLDGDLYDSYRISLEYLYPKVKTGGFVIIDDWCIGGCRKAIQEYFAARGGVPFMSTVDITGRYFIKP